MDPDIDTARLKPGLRDRARRITRACNNCGRRTQNCTCLRRGTTTTERGYGHTHQTTRAALLPNAIGKPCPLCGQPMRADQKLDLDHSIPLIQGGTQGDRIAHAHCNRSAGATTTRRAA